MLVADLQATIVVPLAGCNDWAAVLRKNNTDSYTLVAVARFKTRFDSLFR